MNASFIEEQEKTYQEEFWEQSWFWTLVKQVLAGIAVLIIIFGVIRPLLRDLAKKEEFILEYPEDVLEEEDNLENSDEISKALEKMNAEVEVVGEESAEESEEDRALIEKVKALVSNDPKLASYIIKQWMSEH